MMTKKTTRGKKLELKVVFDTNVIYNLTEYYLLKSEVYEFIKANSALPDIELTWYLPEVVRHERQYQMTTKALDLLKQVIKLEKLLGHNLAITDATIRHHVQETIDRQIEDLNLLIIQADYSKVNWNEFVLSAAYRKPPFSTDKEKGFRDALIVETFFQLVASSPTTPSICRIVLMTEDELLRTAIRSRIESDSNVRILANVEELKGLINTLGSDVTESFIVDMTEKATRYFIDLDNNSGLYYKEEVWRRIQEQYDKQLNSFPEGTNWHNVTRITVGPTRFDSKNMQRFSWVTSITIQIETYHNESRANLVNYFPAGRVITKKDIEELRSGSVFTNRTLPVEERFSGWFSNASNSANPGLPVNWGESLNKALLKTGDAAFEVSWSVTITEKHSFTSAKLESIDYKGTTWTQANGENTSA